MTEYSGHNPVIFLLRHGQVEKGPHKRYIGITDLPLDCHGIDQALYWQQAFAHVQIKATYASALERCTETARMISGRHCVHVTDALNEINLGSWENKRFDQIKARFPGQFKIRGESPDTFTPPGGESFNDVKNRVIPFLGRLPSDGHVLVVTHAGVMRILMTHFLKMPLNQLFTIKLSYGELVVLEKKVV